MITTSIFCKIDSNIKPLKPPIYQGKIIYDSQEIMRNFNAFLENNKFNTVLLIININFFCKNENQRDSDSLKALLASEYGKKQSFWYKNFANEQGRKKYIDNSINRVLNKIKNLPNPNEGQVVINNYINGINSTKIKRSIGDLILKMCIFTFSIININKESSYTTMLDINTVPVTKAFVINEMFPNRMSTSICDVNGYFNRENVHKVFATIMDSIIEYLLEVHIMTYINEEQLDFIKTQVDKCYDPKYNCDNCNNRFYENF